MAPSSAEASAGLQLSGRSESDMIMHQDDQLEVHMTALHGVLERDDEDEPQPSLDSQQDEEQEQADSQDRDQGEACTGEDDDSSDSLELQSARFCTNCTSRLALDEEVCEDCGHAAANDAQLFDAGGAAAASASGLAAAGNTDDRGSVGSVALLFDERMELHDEGAHAPHPERPDRIRSIVARLLSSGLGAQCRRVPCREATLPELCAVHTDSLVHMVEAASLGAAASDTCSFSLTPDTYVNRHTYLCAKLAAGGAAEMAALVARGDVPHGAAIVRPPGHHAESGMAMGFCFFNNAAVAARAAQAAGAQRVIILDWDVHHGNGTQHIFEDDPSVLYMSIHRYDGGSFYPGTGDATEVGRADGRGYTVNVPWDAADMGNGDYLAAFHHVIIPIAYEFNPNLIIVSAGFDAADGDPIGECRVTPECFGHMTSMLKAVAPCLLLLEGGYNLTSTAASTEACLRVLLGEAPEGLPGRRYPSASGWKSVQQAIQVQSAFWRCLRPQSTACLPPPGLKPGRAGVAAACKSQGQGRKVVKVAGGSGGSGKPPRHSNLSWSCRILLKIHKQAMRAFWRRQRKAAKHRTD